MTKFVEWRIKTYRSQKFSNLSSNFLSLVYANYVWYFLKCFFFFENFKFTIVTYGETQKAQLSGKQAIIDQTE